MLELKNISKHYRTQHFSQTALDNVSVEFRENEFVAILGPSGSGKTTMLNIIGGLDRYDAGDVIINRTSTKKYNDRDWDTYRNHRVGFVFQSYNLIPHQSVLSNVELALTIAGISRKERATRAKKALAEVGLTDHMHKRPNQLSGGQMQRVAIARALVNDPDVLLADEPTGALDSETSLQIMELLRVVACDRLVIMVTHNAELATQYATRMIRLRDGRIIKDSNPYTSDDTRDNSRQTKEKPKRKTYASMSFDTSLSLSLTNLRSKIGRTLMTALACSIGIIGIALILSISSGMQDYIDYVQRDTLSSYPLQIQRETFDLEGLTELGLSRMDNYQKKREPGVYIDTSVEEADRIGIVTNHLARFKAYLDDPESEIHQYITERGIRYTYEVAFQAYSYNDDQVIVNTDDDPAERKNKGFFSERMAMFSTFRQDYSESAQHFSETHCDITGEKISEHIKENYQLLAGKWPERYDEVMLVLRSDQSLPAAVLFQLGFITKSTYKDLATAASEGETFSDPVLTYDDVLGHTFSLVPASDYYERDGNLYKPLELTKETIEILFDRGIKVKICGIASLHKDTHYFPILTSIAYTEALTRKLIDRNMSSNLVQDQLADPETNVLTGFPFEAPSDKEKIEDAKDYIAGSDDETKAQIYTLIQLSGNSDEPDEKKTTPETQDNVTQPSGMTEKPLNATSPRALDTESTIPEIQDELTQPSDGIGEPPSPSPPAAPNAEPTMPEYPYDPTVQDPYQDKTQMMSMAMDAWLADNPDEAILLRFYDDFIGGDTYLDNLEDFGYVDENEPSEISLYADHFEDKEKLAEAITNFNASVPEADQVQYTDFVAMMTSSVTSIIRVITYVLIAFVAISLVVSSLMIGIVTNISVLERTKEIGILRSLGASKRNVSQIFNAENLIIGFCSGVLGILITSLLNIPINRIVQNLVQSDTIHILLPHKGAIILVIVSVVITLLGGFLPARKAAKLDPVEALRTE